jgi:hypothetical protein
VGVVREKGESDGERIKSKYFTCMHKNTIIKPIKL